MPRMIILRGPPASGKTTWAKEFVEDHPNCKRICRDDLRAMFDDGVYSLNNEQFIRHAQEALIRAAYGAGKSVILDDTNLRADRVAELTELGSGLGYIVQVRLIDTPLQACIERDARREKPVGEKRIREMHEQLVGI